MLLLFSFFILLSTPEFSYAELTGGFEHEIPDGAWFPGRPLKYPEKEKKFHNAYHDCIDLRQSEGMGLAEAVHACKKKKQGRGGIEDYLGVDEEELTAEVEEAKAEEETVESHYVDVNGDLVINFHSKAEIMEALNKVQINRLRIQEHGNQVALMSQTARGLIMLRQVSKANFNQLFSRGKFGANGNLKQVSKPKFSLNPYKIAAAAALGATTAYAGDACDPYQTVIGMNSLLMAGRQHQFEELKKCSGLTQQILNVTRDLSY